MCGHYVCVLPSLGGRATGVVWPPPPQETPCGSSTEVLMHTRSRPTNMCRSARLGFQATSGGAQSVRFGPLAVRNSLGAARGRYPHCGPLRHPRPWRCAQDGCAGPQPCPQPACGVQRRLSRTASPMTGRVQSSPLSAPPRGRSLTWFQKSATTSLAPLGHRASPRRLLKRASRASAASTQPPLSSAAAPPLPPATLISTFGAIARMARVEAVVTMLLVSQ